MLKTGIQEVEEIIRGDDFLEPILPMRDTVVYPHTTFPVLIGRESSIAAIEYAANTNQQILLCPQKNPEIEFPQPGDLHTTGTRAKIVQVLRLPNSLIKVLVYGIEPVDISSFEKMDDILVGRADKVVSEKVDSARKMGALVEELRNSFERFVMLKSDLPDELLMSYEQIENHEHLLYFVASYLDLDIEKKLKLLNCASLSKRYKLVLTALRSDLELLSVSNEIQEQVQQEIQKNQKKFFIQEQIKVLQQELGDGDYADPDLQSLKDKIDTLDMPDNVREKAIDELDRLKKTSPMSPEHGVARNYLDWLIAMPWGSYSDDNLNVNHVKKALDNDHYGLEKPKERILEHIAVLNLVEKMKGQILCFVGPPGTGKTSLAKSIADAMGRKFSRIALGGIRDEAEIRGHRKTYIGSMPGRIIQAIKKCGTMNPVIVLDEIDKLGSDRRGDPSSAVLEVLDPEQNDAFQDHYMDMEFDLSQVMFITTANVASHIQPALLDRMEIIKLPGYLDYDKLEIAKRHLIPKQQKAHGLQKFKLFWKDDAISKIIRNYTRESGVRNLEQQIAAICRKVAKRWISRQAKGENMTQLTVNSQKVSEFLGVEKFTARDLEKKHKIGTVNGLAWTSTGGAILQIDVASMPGKSKFLLTGKLGDVMKESAQAALTYIRSNAEVWNIDAEFFEKNEIHIHIPEGAIPKDGPSAGLAMALAILSLLTRQKVYYNVAMTGEITLQGEVLPVGGLNEKLLAAQRHGIKKVLIPSENTRHLEDVKEKIKEGLEIVPVEHLTEAISHLFVDRHQI